MYLKLDSLFTAVNKVSYATMWLHLIGLVSTVSCGLPGWQEGPQLWVKLGECRALWGSPELLLLPIVYAKYAIALSILFGSLRCVHTEGWCGCSYSSTPSVHVGSYALALSICLALFSSLSRAYTRGRLVEQFWMLTHVIDNAKIGQER